MTDSTAPKIMANANVDLTSTVGGKFSPSDWEKILERARTQLHEKAKTSDELAAWQAVIRDFHASRYWGFIPNYREPKSSRKPKNLGMQFIWLTFGSLTIMKVAVLWFGQIYSRSDEAFDKWMFFIVLALIIGNILFFLWRNRNHQD
ncbi:MAG: hypothetical protein ACXWQE_07260 [Bdellovibrionales bacterium]